MQKHFPVCPICKSNAGYDTPAVPMPELSTGSENYAQCRSCNATWLLKKNEMRLVEAPKDPRTGLVVGESLVGIGYIYDYWKNWDLESLRRRDEQLRRAVQESELAREQQIQQYREKISRLTVRFSDDEISEESYVRSVKKIEENINRIRGQKEDSTAHKTSRIAKPTASWWLVPFFFGIIGGLVAYVGTKDEDEDMAHGLLIFGIVWTVMVFFVLLYNFIMF